MPPWRSESRLRLLGPALFLGSPLAWVGLLVWFFPEFLEHERAVSHRVIALYRTENFAIVEKGALWRTRYFQVRADRVRQLIATGTAAVRHVPTGDMVADGLTKLASATVMYLIR